MRKERATTQQQTSVTPSSNNQQPTTNNIHQSSSTHATHQRIDPILEQFALCLVGGQGVVRTLRGLNEMELQHDLELKFANRYWRKSEIFI
jgi:hypothetical protein